MLRVCLCLRRTSRRGACGWSTPTIATMGRGATEARSAQSTGPQDFKSMPPPPTGVRRMSDGGGVPASRSTAPYAFLSSASFYDAGDNAQQQAKEQGGTSFNNWRTDRRFSTTPRQYQNIGIRGQPFSASGAAVTSDGSEDGGARRVSRDPTARAEQIHSASSEEGTAPDSSGAGGGGSAEPFESTASWLGGKGRGSSTADPAMSRRRGVGSFSMIDRDQVTLTKLMRMLADATFQPRDADSNVFGGDNRSKMAEQKAELKNLDPRIVPFAHEETMNNYLKNIQQLNSPSGQLISRDMLKGRLVGLLFFSESDRSMRFMRHLKRFHRQHSPDFVVVAVSVGGKEMLDITRGFGFFHCTHRDGATWVKRDAGIMIRPLVPLPRLVVVDGTTGHEVSRSGVTAVMARPDTCFSEWKKGGTGIRSWDQLKAVCM